MDRKVLWFEIDVGLIRDILQSVCNLIFNATHQPFDIRIAVVEKDDKRAGGVGRTFYIPRPCVDPFKGTCLEKDFTRILTRILTKAVLNWSVARRPQLIPLNPIRDYKLPKKDDAIIPPPTNAETTAILKHAAPHLKRAITLSYYIGLRPGAVELLSLTWDRINWDTENILIISAKKGGPEKRMVPIHK